jgi:hypothetical protein
VSTLETMTLRGLTKEGDDSPFLSMADFFSLISLSLIYAMIVLAPQSPAPEDSKKVSIGRVTKEKTQPTAAPNFAYVYVQSNGDSLFIQFRWGAREIRRETTVSGSTNDLAAAERWLKGVLSEIPAPDRIVFYMRGDDTRAETHRMLNHLEQTADEFSPRVETVFILEEEVDLES